MRYILLCPLMCYPQERISFPGIIPTKIPLVLGGWRDDANQGRDHQKGSHHLWVQDVLQDTVYPRGLRPASTPALHGSRPWWSQPSS